MTPIPRACVKTAMAEGAAKIEELAQAIESAKAETKDAARTVNVQTRYASRVQNVLKANFEAAQVTLIEADKAALEARGK